MTQQIVAQFVKRFPGATVIHADLALTTDQFSITVLMGPSGCGKTTILRTLAGLERPETGTITCGDEVWFDAERFICRSPQQRDIGFCFQDHALFPHMTVRQNIAYGLKTSKSQQARTVDEMLERFQLTGLGQRYPRQISGGEQQRVALARVLVRQPRLLLLDEPLAALDTVLREEVRIKLRSLLAEFGIPVVMVTHDRREAMAVADRVVVMSKGRIEQSDTVEEVFSRPRNAAVARIVGIETVIAGRVVEVQQGLATVDIHGVTLTTVALADGTPRVLVCIRGEDVALHREEQRQQSSRNQLPATIRWITCEGPLMRVGLDCGFELTALVTRRAFDELELKIGDRITAVIKATAMHTIAI